MRLEPWSNCSKRKTIGRMFYYKGKHYSVSELSKMCGMNRNTLKSRIDRGKITIKEIIDGKKVT